jgi:hypothetical protein
VSANVAAAGKQPSVNAAEGNSRVDGNSAAVEGSSAQAGSDLK